MNIPKKVTHTWLLTTTRTTACWAVPRGIFPRQLHAKTTRSVSRLLLWSSRLGLPRDWLDTCQLRRCRSSDSVIFLLLHIWFRAEWFKDAQVTFRNVTYEIKPACTRICTINGNVSIAATRIFCRAPPVFVGDPANLTCHFPQDLRQSRKSVAVVRRDSIPGSRDGE